MEFEEIKQEIKEEIIVEEELLESQEFFIPSPNMINEKSDSESNEVNDNINVIDELFTLKNIKVFQCSPYRSLHLDEVLEQLENTPISESDSDENEDNIIACHRKEDVTVYITPPENDLHTDEDSGNEEQVHISNLPGNQITSSAIVSQSKKADTNIFSVTSNNVSFPAKKKVKIREWHQEDLQGKNQFVTYPYKPSVADLPRKPFEILELFLDYSALDLLTSETVNYAAQAGNHSFMLTIDEMKVFVGILLLSGYCSVSRRRLFWATELDTRNELVVNSMRRNRFDEIMRYFHAANNAELCVNDKFAKIRPLLNTLNANFLAYGSAFGPCNISIDESMIPYYGRHPTKQFIHGKPIRWGYKGWVAASPLGYAYHIDIYQRKLGEDNQGNYEKDFGLGGAVILDIVDQLERAYANKKFCFYFDNFFTSLRLIDEIEKRGHGATGTVRSNRVEKCPLTDSKKFAKLPRGSEEHFLDKDSNILVVRWNDNGIVCIVSNQHGLLPLKKAERYSAVEKKRVLVPMPCVINEYNRHMGGVDRMDENISYYRIAIRGKKWYFPVISYLINVCVNNAWLFGREGGYKEDMLSFTRAIVNHWLKTHGTLPQNPGKQRLQLVNAMITDEIRYDKLSHDIVESQQKTRRRCKQCKSQTIYMCNKCNVHLHYKCSNQYHTL